MKALISRFRYHLAVFFAVLGPGFITAVVDNDSGGILTYSQAGARFGYLPLWTLLPITVLLIIAQEMCSRMGAVTGKGLSDLIREEFGLRITFIMMALLVAVNLTNVMSEFAGVKPAMRLSTAHFDRPGPSQATRIPSASAATMPQVLQVTNLGKRCRNRSVMANTAAKNSAVIASGSAALMVNSPPPPGTCS